MLYHVIFFLYYDILMFLLRHRHDGSVLASVVAG